MFYDIPKTQKALLSGNARDITSTVNKHCLNWPSFCQSTMMCS